MTRRMSTAVIGLAAVSMLSTGCGYPGDAQDRAADGAPPTATETVTVGPDGTPTTTPGSSSSSTSSTGSPMGSPRATGTKVDLTPESGTLYVRSIQAFSPKLERWVVDLDAKTISFEKYICLGRKVASVKSMSVEPATVAQPPAGATIVEATWPSGRDDPQYPQSGSTTTTFEVYDEYLRVRASSEAATTDAEAATGQFIDSCGDTAGAVADFVF